MKPVIAISIEDYESMLKRATEDSSLYFRLKKAVKMANTVVVRCDPEDAGMLLQVAKHFSPDVVREIQQAIRVFCREEAEQAGSLIWHKKRRDELAREYLKTRNPEAGEEFTEWRGSLGREAIEGAGLRQCQEAARQTVEAMKLRDCPWWPRNWRATNDQDITPDQVSEHGIFETCSVSIGRISRLAGVAVSLLLGRK
jgi:hypothetical protein